MNMINVCYQIIIIKYIKYQLMKMVFFYRTRDNDGNLSNFNKTNYDKIER